MNYTEILHSMVEMDYEIFRYLDDPVTFLSSYQWNELLYLRYIY